MTKGTQKSTFVLNRLKSNKDISAIFQKGRRLKSKSAMVLWVENSEGAQRYAICVSKKHGGAVVRNRIKRVIRSLAHQLQTHLPPAVDFVILPSTYQKNWSAPQLKKEFEILFQKFLRAAGGTGSAPEPPQG